MFIISCILIIVFFCYLRNKINGKCPICNSRHLLFKNSSSKEFWTCCDCGSCGSVVGGAFYHKKIVQYSNEKIKD
jgi:hypothetical protein